MGIFLIIIGALLVLFGAFFWLPMYISTKNQANWDKFYKEAEEKLPAIPEETVYNIVLRMKLGFGCAALLGLVCLMGGILMQTL